MKKKIVISLLGLSIILSMNGCGKKVEEKSTVSEPSSSVSVDIPDIEVPTQPTIDATTEEIIKNNNEELAKVEQNNRDIENNSGTLKISEDNFNKMQTAEFVTTAKRHNLYCLFEYNGSEEPVITFTSPSGDEYNADSPSVVYTPKGEYSFGTAYEITDAEAGKWTLHYISKGSTIITYSVTDITDFMLNLLPSDFVVDDIE